MSRSLFRKPSLKRSIKARTTGRAKRAVKRAFIPGYGRKGMGFVRNPKRSIYNAVYHRTSIDILKPIKNNAKRKNTSPKSENSSGHKNNNSSKSCLTWILSLFFLILFFVNKTLTLIILVLIAIIWLIIRFLNKNKPTAKNTSNRKNNAKQTQTELIKNPTKNIKKGLLIISNNTYHINSKVFPLLYFSDGKYQNINEEALEPSAISVKLPVTSGNYKKLGYYPNYKELTPEQRNAFLNWLSKDLSTIPDIGFAFLLLYCLERHILKKEYIEKCLDIISKLQSETNNNSFKFYSTTSIAYIILIYKRTDLISHINLAGCASQFNILLRTDLTVDEIISYANKVGFENKRYLKKYPKLFKKALAENLTTDYGSAKLIYKFSDKEIQQMGKAQFMFSNYSLREILGTDRADLEIPDPFTDLDFCLSIRQELQKAHEQVKSFLKIKRAAEPKEKTVDSRSHKRINPNTGYPMSTDKQIKTARNQIKLTKEVLKNKAENRKDPEIRQILDQDKDSKEKFNEFVFNSNVLEENQADLAYKEGKWDEAEKFWLKSVAVSPYSADRLRIMYQKEHRFKDAADILNFSLNSVVVQFLNENINQSIFSYRYEKARKKFEKHKNDDRSKLSEENWKELDESLQYWRQKMNKSIE